MVKKPNKPSTVFDAKKSVGFLSDNYRTQTENRTDSEKLTLLDYLIDIILDDICTEVECKPLFGYTDPNSYKRPFLIECLDENGGKIEIRDGTTDVSLKNSNIFVCPWNMERRISRFFDLSKTEFKNDANHRGMYFADINLCFVTGGFHSIHAGHYFKKGKIKVENYNTPLLYSHVNTDGANWINARTGEIIEPVADFRFAAVYSLARERYKLREPSETQSKPPEK